MNGWYVPGVADKQYKIRSCVFPHWGGKKVLQLLTWVLNLCKTGLQTHHHKRLSASSRNFTPRLQINYIFYRIELQMRCRRIFDSFAAHQGVEICKCLGVCDQVVLSWICLVFRIEQRKSVHVPLAGLGWAGRTCGEVALATGIICICCRFDGYRRISVNVREPFVEFWEH